MIDVGRRLCEDMQIPVAELWAYTVLGDQPRFTLVQKSAVPEVKARTAAPAAKRKTAAKQTARPAARRAPARKPASRTARPASKKSASIARTQKRK
ncbi:MAG: hypothetical protein DMF88_16945 [Acidobacteria bacterium]|nr:MAG: hypothetical protein DMF88_16945 [Acidobacteriota bacterium]